MSVCLPTTYNQLSGSFSTISLNDSQETLCISEGHFPLTTSFTHLGLPNLLFTCYMNAAMQALLTLEKFIDEIYRQKRVWGQHPCSVHFQQILNIVNCQFEPDFKKKNILSDFKQTVADFNKEFSDDDQKDTHEFMICVFDILRSSKSEMQDLSSALNTLYSCPVDAHISFQMINIRTCSGCGSESKNIEDCICLILKLTASDSADGCLREYLKGGCVEFSCNCGSHESSQKAIFKSLPNVLILQLQRFTTQDNNTVKEKRAIYLAPNLEIPKKFCNNATKSVQYSLVSIVSHLGPSLNYGHYICDGVNRQRRQSSESWLTYDDNVVTETPMQDVLYQRRTSAYLLFYEREKC
uniref:ubiquitinyl hydrolase 1 n=1 Tax=Gouania willdenowi TaxID=441366 RepID=A0A8C5D8X5_GOUWI